MLNETNKLFNNGENKMTTLNTQKIAEYKDFIKASKKAKRVYKKLSNEAITQNDKERFFRLVKSEVSSIIWAEKMIGKLTK